jgi:NAD(P)-dependent dehydrogenase (short-subunit alcohol dehydrogenase family)
MRRVLVVGGAGSLGSELVRQLLDGGVEVAVAGRSRAPDPRARLFHAIDAASADWRSVYSAVEAGSSAPIDGVIFVAGTAAYGKTTLFPAEKARAILELNFWAAARAALAAAEHWAGAGRTGTFAAVLSIAARRAVPFEAYYAASKAAAARFLECLDLEYAPRGIRFLSAFPGTLNTPFRARADWFGLEPARGDRGADVARTARAILRLLEGRRRARVIGWRERTIDLADRLAPGLYDRVVLRRRVARTTE